MFLRIIVLMSLVVVTIAPDGVIDPTPQSLRRPAVQPQPATTQQDGDLADPTNAVSSAGTQDAPGKVDLIADQRVILSGQSCPECENCELFTEPIEVHMGPDGKLLNNNDEELPACLKFVLADVPVKHPCTDAVQDCNINFQTLGNGLIVKASSDESEREVIDGMLNGTKRLLCGTGNEGHGITVCRFRTNVTIKNFRICNFKHGIAVADNSIYENTPPPSTVLENNEIVDGGWGIFISGCGGAQFQPVHVGAQIRSNTITGCDAGGIRLQAGVLDATIERNQVIANVIGIHSNSTVGGDYFLNEIRDNGSDGLNFRLAENHRVHDNLVCGNAVGIEFGNCNTPLLDGTLPNIIYNNIFDNTVHDGRDFCGTIVNEWNVPVTPGTNILGGPCLGGNVWSGYSETCQAINTQPGCPDTFCEPLLIPELAMRHDEFPLKLVGDPECVFPEPLVCDAGGPYSAQCAGPDTAVSLDGGGSVDPDDDPRNFDWTTDCPGGTFDDNTLASPTLTIDTVAPCPPLNCNVFLTVSDGLDSTDCQTTVTVEDTTHPDIICPTDALNLECPADTSVAAQGSATASDNCAAVTIGSSDVSVAGCGNTETITRIWTAADECSNSSSCDQTIATVDTTVPSVSCPADTTVECDGAGNTADLDTFLAGAIASDTCGGASLANDFAGLVDDCGATGSATVGWIATDDCGNPNTCASSFIIEDTTGPVVSVDTTPIVVTDTDCSGGEAVPIPTGSATDVCGPASVANDAPSPFPAGQTTTVTYTATDDCNNTSTDSLDVTVLYGADIFIEANMHTVGSGSQPGSTKEPLVGIQVCAYDKADSSCSRDVCGGISHQHYQCIVDDCGTDDGELIFCCTTDGNGVCMINAPPGDYIVISEDATKTVLPDPLGVSASDLVCGELKRKHLQQIVNVQSDGAVKKRPGKTTRLTGSELLIIEPEFVVWDDTEQAYPFVFESVGDWGVTTSVAPPEGFVADYNSLSADVDNTIAAVQFIITEVGSDLVPTETTFEVSHNGQSHVVHGHVGIMLTPGYAESRGFNVALLRAQGLIKEHPGNQGQGQGHGQGQGQGNP